MEDFELMLEKSNELNAAISKSIQAASKYDLKIGYMKAVQNLIKLWVEKGNINYPIKDMVLYLEEKENES